MNVPKDAREDFERYCRGCEGSVPPPDSEAWNRLAGAFLTYRALRTFNIRGTQTGRFSAKEPNK